MLYWGGDTAVEATRALSDDKQVDVLVTVDPVTFPDAIDILTGYSSSADPKAHYWINIYADGGTPFGLPFRFDKQVCVEFVNFYFTTELVEFAYETTVFIVDDVLPEIEKCIRDGVGCSENIGNQFVHLLQDTGGIIGHAGGVIVDMSHEFGGEIISISNQLNDGINHVGNQLNDGLSELDPSRLWRHRSAPSFDITKKYCIPYIEFGKYDTWDVSDWIAFVGGKGTSWHTFYPDKIHPDVQLKVKAHHEEFVKMLRKMQKNPRYDFGLK